ncbi:MAG: inositol monophosphatase family protein [Promethearchaeota archaeon]
MSKYSQKTEKIIDAIKDAMRVTEWFQKEGFKIYRKQDTTPVTHADLASQILIVSRIKENYPEDMIIAEEDQEFIDETTEKIIKRCFHEVGLNDSLDINELMGHKGIDSHRQWTIDPIDGTEGFSSGLVYAIGVSFMIDNDPRMCVIGVPRYNDRSNTIFIAEKEKGAYCSISGSKFKSIQVNQQDDLNQIKMCHSLHYDEPWVVKFAKKIGFKELIQIDSMAKFCMVADGKADLYIKPIDKNHSFSWDFAPGYLLMKEAGGKITDLNGKELQFNAEHMICNTPGLIASNGEIHDLILNELESIKFWI